MFQDVGGSRARAAPPSLTEARHGADAYSVRCAPVSGSGSCLALSIIHFA